MVVIIFSTSCNVISTNSDFSEVDFSSEAKINVEYKFEVFDAFLCYENGCLNFKYSDNCGAISDTVVTINAQEYSFLNNDIKFTGNTKDLNENFLPLIIYDLLSENDGKIVAQSYDDIKECFYFEESISDIFLRFEIYENNGQSYCCLIIT